MSAPPPPGIGPRGPLPLILGAFFGLKPTGGWKEELDWPGGFVFVN